MPERDDLPLLVFDGDDTLWMTEPLYDEARAEARAVVERDGRYGVRWEELERRLDVENVARFGLSAKRFPTSCVEAYYAVCAEESAHSSEVVAEKVRTAAAQVFVRQAPVVPGARDVLARLRRHFRLALLTQGDPEIQERRIDDSGLRELFDRVAVVPAKNAEVLAELVKSLHATPAKTWMVGNSVPSDVNPALATGMRAVWVDSHVWEHERRESVVAHDRMLAVERLTEIPDLIGAG